MHMLQVERIERRVLGERQAVLQLSLGVGVEVDLPSVQEALDAFEAALVDTGEVVDQDEDDLLRALGLR